MELKGIYILCNIVDYVMVIDHDIDAHVLMNTDLAILSYMFSWLVHSCHDNVYLVL